MVALLAAFGAELQRPLKTRKRSFAITWRRARLGFALPVAFLALTAPAVAQSCSALQAELSDLRSMMQASGPIHQAIAQQRRELGRAQRAADRSACWPGVSPSCDRLLQTIGIMQNNLAIMQRRAGNRGAPPGTEARIVQIERVIAANCRVRQRPARGNDLLASLFGNRGDQDGRYGAPRYDRYGRPLPQVDSRPSFREPPRRQDRPAPTVSRGTYRTMCVREDDGFFWPISFSTTRDRFDQDRQVCQSMCPGRGVDLFAYRNPGEQIEDMVSTTSGQRYSEMQTAFAFRQNFDADNRCSTSGDTALFEPRRLDSGNFTSYLRDVPPAPVPRPNGAPDPESVALSEAKTSFDEMTRMTEEADGSPEGIRVVGPRFQYLQYSGGRLFQAFEDARPPHQG